MPLVWTGTAVADTDYSAMPTSVTFAPKVGSVTLTLTPLPNAALRTSAVATVYVPRGRHSTVGANGSASVVIAPAGNATGTGLTGYYFQDSSTSNIGTYSPNLFLPAEPQAHAARSGDQLHLDHHRAGQPDARDLLHRALGRAGAAAVFGDVLFRHVTDDGVKLWVNGQLIIDGWAYNLSADRIGSITLQAGVLYDIKMEYYQATGTATASLSWYSNSQVKQIIPATCLYPDTTRTPRRPSSAATNAIGFVGQPFSFTVAATATLTTRAAPMPSAPQGGTLPPGLTLNASTGVISGTPTTAGTYTVALTASNSYGTGASSLTIQILPAGTGSHAGTLDRSRRPGRF